MATYNELITEIDVIKNETASKANTATRVGTALKNITHYAGDVVELGATFNELNLLFDLPNTNTQFARNKVFWINPTQIELEEIGGNGSLIFYYDYSYLGADSKTKAIGESFEIYFRPVYTTTAQFITFNGDYFNTPIPVLANKYYKLSVKMLPVYNASSQPFVWATLEEVATPANN